MPTAIAGPIENHFGDLFEYTVVQIAGADINPALWTKLVTSAGKFSGIPGVFQPVMIKPPPVRTTPWYLRWFINSTSEKKHTAAYPNLEIAILTPIGRKDYYTFKGKFIAEIGTKRYQDMYAPPAALTRLEKNSPGEIQTQRIDLLKQNCNDLYVMLSNLSPPDPNFPYLLGITNQSGGAGFVRAVWGKCSLQKLMQQGAAQAISNDRAQIRAKREAARVQRVSTPEIVFLVHVPAGNHLRRHWLV